MPDDNARYVHVPGIPAPQGSKRHVGGGRMIESSKHVGPWRERVALAAYSACPQPILGALRVSLLFTLPRPKSHYRTGRNAHLLREAAPDYPTGKPDVDKLARAILDALTGIWWDDDSRVVSLDAVKVYGPDPSVSIFAVGAGTNGPTTVTNQEGDAE